MSKREPLTISVDQADGSVVLVDVNHDARLDTYTVSVSAELLHARPDQVASAVRTALLKVGEG